MQLHSIKQECIINDDLTLFIRLCLFQTYMNFFPLLNIKEDILKNINNYIVDGSHWPLIVLFPYYGSQWSTFQLPTFLKKIVCVNVCVIIIICIIIIVII